MYIFLKKLPTRRESFFLIFRDITLRQKAIFQQTALTVRPKSFTGNRLICICYIRVLCK